MRDISLWFARRCVVLPYFLKYAHAHVRFFIYNADGDEKLFNIAKVQQKYSKNAEKKKWVENGDEKLLAIEYWKDYILSGICLMMLLVSSMELTSESM